MIWTVCVPCLGFSFVVCYLLVFGLFTMFYRVVAVSLLAKDAVL